MNTQKEFTIMWFIMLVCLIMCCLITILYLSFRWYIYYCWSYCNPKNISINTVNSPIEQLTVSTLPQEEV